MEHFFQNLSLSDASSDFTNTSADSTESQMYEITQNDIEELLDPWKKIARLELFAENSYKPQINLEDDCYACTNFTHSGFN
jgi:hypothetical protein